MTKERWLPVRIKGRKTSYEVSDRGNVRHAETKHLKNTFTIQGYRHVGLYVNRCESMQRVAKLVSLAFHGPTPRGKKIAYENLNKLDDRATNLIFLTLSEAIKRSYRHTNRPRCGSLANTRLSRWSYDQIKLLWATGKYDQSRIARATGLNNASVCKIIHRTTTPKRWGKKDIVVDRAILTAPTRQAATRTQKLTDEQVIAILAARGKELARDLALIHGCAKNYIYLLWGNNTARSRRLQQLTNGTES